MLRRSSVDSPKPQFLNSCHRRSSAPGGSTIGISSPGSRHNAPESKISSSLKSKHKRRNVTRQATDSDPRVAQRPKPPQCWAEQLNTVSSCFINGFHMFSPSLLGFSKYLVNCDLFCGSSTATIREPGSKVAGHGASI